MKNFDLEDRAGLTNRALRASCEDVLRNSLNSMAGDVIYAL